MYRKFHGLLRLESRGYIYQRLEGAEANSHGTPISPDETIAVVDHFCWGDSAMRQYDSVKIP